MIKFFETWVMDLAGNYTTRLDLVIGSGYFLSKLTTDFDFDHATRPIYDIATRYIL